MFSKDSMLFISLLLFTFLSLHEFGLANSFNKMRANTNTTTTNRTSNGADVVNDGDGKRDRNHNLSLKRRTKVTSNRQKFFDSNTEVEELENYNGTSATTSSFRKRDNTNIANIRRRQFFFRRKQQQQQQRQRQTHKVGSLLPLPLMMNNKVDKKSQSPSNWKLDWDKDWEAEISAGLAAVHILPDGKHVSAYLGRGVLGRFLFLNDKVDGSLSITVTPCTSILRWSVKMVPVNESNFSTISLKQNIQLETFRTQRINTFRIFRTQVTIYMIEIRPLYSDTFVQILISTENILEPFFTTQQDLILQPFSNTFTIQEMVKSTTSFNYNFISTSQMFLNPRVIVRRLRGNRIQVKWDSSPVNPKFMEYCIVVNTQRDYSTLCEAQGTKYGVVPPNLLDLPYYVYQSPSMTSTSPSFVENSVVHDAKEMEVEAGTEPEPERKVTKRGFVKDDDFIIGCINKRRNYVLTDLKEGRLYYFNVFIRDLRTNLSYPYVRTTLKYKTPPKTETNVLRDSKPMKVRLNEGNSTLLKFNLKKHCSELTMYIMPCGGGFISYEVYTTSSTGNHSFSLYRSAIVENLEIIKTAEVPPGKYFIKVQSYVHHHDYVPGNRSTTTTTLNSRNGARMVEIYFSAKDKKFPLPKLPANTKVNEVLDEKMCDSVTIEWWPSPDDRDNEYCFFLKQEQRRRLFLFKAPNQCDVERSLQSDPYVSHSTCLQKTPKNSNTMLRHKITGLQNAKTYELQLIVRRHNKKALSYELFHVSTLESCLEK